MLNGETYSTASFNADTPEGHYGRRRLYHTNPIEYDRLQNVSRRINGGNSNYTPFFTGTPRATKTNPKWWMKVKIFFQEQFWFKDPAGVIAIAAGLTIFVIITIAKILSVW